MVESRGLDDKKIAVGAKNERCLMAMALVRRPGRCLERLADDQLQGVERGGADTPPPDRELASHPVDIDEDGAGGGARQNHRSAARGRGNRALVSRKDRAIGGGSGPVGGTAREARRDPQGNRSDPPTVEPGFAVSGQSAALDRNLQR